MDQATTVPLPRRVAGWHLVLALGVTVTCAYYWFAGLGSDWAGTQVALYSSANGALAVSALLAAWRHPRLRLPLVLVQEKTRARMREILTELDLLKEASHAVA